MARKRRNRGGTPPKLASSVTSRPAPKLQSVAAPARSVTLQRFKKTDIPKTARQVTAKPLPVNQAVLPKPGLLPRRPASMVRLIETGLQRSTASPVREPERRTCKDRPKSNRSKGGGSRDFVPWCR